MGSENPETYKSRLINELINEEQVNLIIGAFASTACGALYYLLSLNLTNSIRNSEYIVYWLTLQIIVTIFWASYMWFYNKTPFYRRNWRLTATLHAAFYALVWSISWFVFVDRAHPELLVIWLFIITGVSYGGAFTTALHWPTTILFMSFLIPPIFFDLLINQGLYAQGLMYFAVAGYATGIIFGYFLSRFTVNAIAQREKNYLLAKQLEKEKQQAEKANQEKTRFLAAASHDLRQPIQAIRLFEHILESRLNDPENKQLLKKISNSTDSLATLLDSLLDISRLDAGIIDIKKQTFCVNDVLARVYQQYHPIAAKEGIELRYVPSYVSIGSDPQQLERVIRNLIVNAIKHMGTGSILFGVRRSTSEILIIDNGVGIPIEEQKKIFDEFYQLKNPERNRSKGLGLGLSIVQRTVLLLGHSLSLESKPNQGCKFAIQLPIINESQNTVKLASVSEDIIFETEKAKNILIIEDEEEVLHGLDALLKSWGHNTFLARNKNEALNTSEQQDIQIIVSDYQLQNNDNGINIISAIHDLYQYKIPAIVVTGNTNPSILKKISRYKIPILSKPYLPSELAVELNRFQ